MMKTSRWLPYLLCFYFCLAANMSLGATVSFSETLGQNWNTPSNWSPTAPTTNDLAEIFATAEVPNGTAMASYIDVRQGGVLNVNGGDLVFGFANNRWMWVGWQSAGTVNHSSGDVTAVGSNADVIIDDAGVYNMTGGSLVISDDLRLVGDAEFNISGQSNVAIGDDLRIANNSSVTFNVELMDDVVPTIHIADDLVLRNSTTLNIDSSNWSGDGSIALFDVGGSIQGEFAAVYLNGELVDDTDYAIESGSVVISVPEPPFQPATLLIAVSCLAVCARPANRRRLVEG